MRIAALGRGLLLSEFESLWEAERVLAEFLVFGEVEPRGGVFLEGFSY